ncbi:hypothetical protein [Streptomyces sp.]|uniref:hypothetical protein n=1 Tax=Streptomyces sp. TaxID=1931 RepID=UPI0028126466|nr:hypothetical protein [Streptomyces sp.]
MTAPVDLELELIGRAAAHWPDAVVRDELDNRLLEELPTIQIEMLGGDDDGFRLDRVLVDINIYAATRGDALALAGEVHLWMLHEVRSSTTPTAVIGRTGTITRPAIRPYTNTALRRVGATYQIFCHPVS